MSGESNDMFFEYLTYLRKIEEGIPIVMERTLNAILSMVFNEVVRNTPTITGELKRNYRTTDAKWISTSMLNGEIFNNLEYSIYEELGHRQKKRWVPGYWGSNGFVYDPSSKEGMMLEDKWISGSFRLTTIAEKYNNLIPKVYAQELSIWKKENDMRDN